MKKLLALLLVLCACVAVLSSCASCASCASCNFDIFEPLEESEVPTASTVPKEFADAKLASKVKGGMKQEDVKKLLGVEPISCECNYAENAEAYRLDDGRAVYITYNKNGGVKYASVHKMVDSSHLDQIKEGYHYDKITEILGGVEGITLTSSGMGSQLYILSDGRALYITYEPTCYFATGMRITSADGKTEILGAPAQKAKKFDDFDLFKQHLIENYKENIVIPKLLSSEYKFGKGIDSRECFSYSFGTASDGQEDKEFYNGWFTVEVYKIDILYEDMVDFYKTKENEEVIECREGVSFVKEWGRFLFNNNGRVITVDIPTTLREDMPWNRDENSPPAITTLEELEKYLVIEYLDLPGAEE